MAESMPCFSGVDVGQEVWAPPCLVSLWIPVQDESISRPRRIQIGMIDLFVRISPPGMECVGRRGLSTTAVCWQTSSVRIR